ncbi:uncharacterized protein LOC143448822 [Clavelina lepadiformis]|uniref:uncharacterized protein LOC143448822 n=1 Tax=Clavelina lepadiformis TaxID=159417 RepID=UPI0040412EA2
MVFSYLLHLLLLFMSIEITLTLLMGYQAKVRIFNDGYDPLDTEDVAEWEKQQALGRSGNLFEFFFQHNAGGRKKEKSEDNPFEELFKSFSEHRRRTTPRMDPLADGFDRPNPNARRPQPKQQFNEQKTKQTDPTSQDQHFRQFQHQDPRFQQQQERTQPYGRQPTQNREPPPPTQPQQPRQQYQQQRSSTDQQRSGQQQRQQSQGHSKRWQSGQEDRFRSAWQQRNRDQRQDPLHATQHQQFSQQRQSHPNPRQQTSQSQRHFERPHQSFGSQHQPIKNRQNYQTDFDEQQRQHAGDPRQYQQGKATKDDKSYRRSDRQSEPQQYEDGRQSADQRQRHHDEKPVLKKTTKKKKTSFKKKRTMTAEEKEITKQYTRGTDGRWYHKGKDGRWRVHNGPPPDPTKKKVPPTQTRKTQSSSKQSQQSQQRQSNKPDAEQKPNENSYRDEKGNIYVRGLDGNWYMRVQPPPKKQDDKKSDRQEQWDNQKQATDQHWTHRPHNKNKKQDSSTRFQQTQRSQYDGMNQEARSRSQDQHQTSFQSQQQQQHHKGEHRSTTAHSQQQRQAHGTSSDLPRGLFYNERQQISDRIGNIYERFPDGRYKLFMAASEARQRLKDQLRNHKQSDFLKPKGEERPTPPPPLPKQQVYHDSEGNVFVKDAHGNLIKVQPGQQGKAQTHHQQQQSHTRQEMPRKDKTGFSYEDPNQRRAEQKWRKQEEKVDYGDEGSNQQQSHPPPNRQQYHAYAGQQQQQFQARQQDSRYTRGSQPRQFTRQRTQGDGHQHYHRDYQQSARHHRPAHEEL